MQNFILIGWVAASMSLLCLPVSAQDREAQGVLACGGTVEGKTLTVRREEATCPWSFDVEQMSIRCNSFGPRSGEVYFTSEKGAFALNGNAKQTYDDPRPIWLDDPQWEGAKISVQSWIAIGLELC